MNKTIIALALAALSGTAFASEPSYTYVEGGYQKYDIDDSLLDTSTDGFYLSGSYEFGDSGLYMHGRYQDSDFDYGFDLTDWDVGLGYYFPVGQNASVFTELSYVEYDISTPISGISLKGDGYRAGLGAKMGFANNWEGMAKVNYRDVEDMGNWAGVVGVNYRFSPAWSVGGEVEIGQDDLSQYRLGLRYSF